MGHPLPRGQRGRGWCASDALAKYKIVALVEREGIARSFKVDSVNAKTLRNILVTNIDRKSVLNTDEASYYK